MADGWLQFTAGIKVQSAIQFIFRSVGQTNISPGIYDEEMPSPVRSHFSRQLNIYGHCVTLAYAQISHSSLLQFARLKNCLKLNNAVKQNVYSRHLSMRFLESGDFR